MRYVKGAAVSFGVFAVSFLLILLWGQWNPEALLSDDNRTQWFPVIERAYADFFRTGKMPVYDFYQIKGMSIADPGYYGIVNPVMLLSYMLAHFTPLPFSTMTIHIGILFSLGNVCFYWLCRCLGRNFGVSVLCTAAYSAASSFLAFHYWYYVFNNYLFIPLLLLVFWKGRGRNIEFIGCGLVLALEILFGNVQYTCYHYMLYAVLCLTMVIFKRKRYIGVFFSNIVCAVVLSAPFLLQLMQASDSFGGDGFHFWHISKLELLLGALVPCGILQKLGVQHLPFSNAAMGRGDYTWLWNGGFAAFWLVLAIGGVIWLIRSRKRLAGVNFKQEHTLKEWWSIIFPAARKYYHEKIERKDGGHLLIIGICICLWFFVSFITGGLVAWILGSLPVIRQFRFLFKCIFIIQPFVAVLTVAVWPHIRGKLKTAAVSACCVFTAVGLVNNGFVSGEIVPGLFTNSNSMTLSEEIASGEAIEEAQTPDLDIYRYMTLCQTDVYVMPDTFHYDNGFLRNFATTMGIYSLGGYEISAPEEHLHQFDALYDFNHLYTRMVNCGMAYYFIQNAEHFPEETEAQLIANSVKYIFVQKEVEDTVFSYYAKGYGDWESTDSYRRFQRAQPDLENADFTGLVLESLDYLDGISVAEVRSVNEYYDVIVLEGVNSLCRDGAGTALPLTSERMDTLSFAANGADSYTLSFSYEEELTAWSEDAQGGRTQLTVSQNEDGNTVIHADGMTNATIHLSYQDTLSGISFIFAAVIVLLFFVMIAVLFRAGRKKS